MLQQFGGGEAEAVDGDEEGLEVFLVSGQAGGAGPGPGEGVVELHPFGQDLGAQAGEVVLLAEGVGGVAEEQAEREDEAAPGDPLGEGRVGGVVGGGHRVGRVAGEGAGGKVGGWGRCAGTQGISGKSVGPVLLAGGGM